MTPEQKAELAEAVTCLIEDADAPAMFRQLTGVYDIARKGVPVRLVGRVSVLNPLLLLWLDDEPAAQRVIDLINRKRRNAGLDPVGDQDFQRRSYMRELMAQKRERGRRLVELVNTLRSDNDRIKGSARIELERQHAARWFAVKQQREEDARARLGRRLSAEELDNIREQLWRDVDAELDALETFAHEQLRKPLHQRRPEGFPFTLQPRKGST